MKKIAADWEGRPRGPHRPKRFRPYLIVLLFLKRLNVSVVWIICSTGKRKEKEVILDIKYFFTLLDSLSISSDI